MICDTILDAVGNTPLIRLHRMVKPGFAEVLVKFEGLEVGGSIKTRTALRMIEQAEKDGKIDKDKIVESLESKGAKIIDVYEENGEVVVQAEYDVVFADNETADIEVGEAEIDAAESTYYMYPANATSKTL